MRIRDGITREKKGTVDVVERKVVLVHAQSSAGVVAPSLGGRVAESDRDGVGGVAGGVRCRTVYLHEGEVSGKKSTQSSYRQRASPGDKHLLLVGS